QSSEYDMDTTPYRFDQVLHSEFAGKPNFGPLLPPAALIYFSAINLADHLALVGHLLKRPVTGGMGLI
ncbi:MULTISPECIES: hypothetical protein, partial [Halomonadaceae]|uniref:hypothetical protein n=1 Tax=Halomonadaceae TaxID=28256 RepID=UPI001C2DFE9B